jgi:hypothetical protein
LFKRRNTPTVLFLVGLLGVQVGVQAAEGQATGALIGRVVDAETGRGIADATVALVDTERSALTDTLGMFHLTALPSGEYTLRIGHLTYGEFEQAVQIEEGEEQALRIRLSTVAIELDPVVVEALTQDQLDARSRGTRRNIITREEIADMQATGGHLGHILARRVPGIRLRTDQSRSGEPVCLEFRTPVSLQNPLGCKPPLVFLDGVRVSSPDLVFATLPTENIERMEVIPPGEAGVAYGTDSRYGVLLIETRTAASVLGEVREEPPVMRGFRYDWALEPEPYQWKKALGLSLLGSTAGIVLGQAVARKCLSFDDLSSHFYESRCPGLGTAGARLALLPLPQIGASLAARYAGSTSLSRGKLGHTLLATSMISVPGVLLSLTSQADGFTGSAALGNILLGLGVPVAATLADWMFRGFRAPGK